jgi:hypothetical protein
LIEPYSKYTIDYNFYVLVFNVDYFDSFDFSEDNKTFDNQFPEFKTEFGCVESDENVVKQKSENIITSSNALYSTLEIYYWVINNIDYLYEGEGTPGDALKTLETKKGICHSYSCLYAALLRAIDIPVNYVTLYSLDNNSIALHAGNEIYSKKYKLWLPVDTTWGQTINDWYLSRGTTQVRIGELYPPAYDVYWLKSYGGQVSFVEEYGSYEIVSEDHIWNDSLVYLYELSDTIGYSDSFHLRNKAKYDLVLQEAVDDYYSDENISDGNIELINNTIDKIYLDILADITDNYLSTKQKINDDINEIRTMEQDINKLGKMAITIDISGNYSEDMLTRFENNLDEGTAAINSRDFNSAKEKINYAETELSNLKAKEQVLSLTATTYSSIIPELSRYSGNDINYISDYAADNNLSQDSNKQSNKVSNTTIWIIIIMSVFWLWMFIDCIINHSLKGKVWWVLLILLTYILFWIGAILYFLIKYIPRIIPKNKKTKKYK